MTTNHGQIDAKLVTVAARLNANSAMETDGLVERIEMRKILVGLLLAICFHGVAISKDTNSESAKVMQDLRIKALALKPSDIGINRSNFPRDVWGVLMETAYPEGAFSLVVLADGSTSLYFSTGGGIIGAGGYKSVKESSSSFIGWANKLFSAASPAPKQPLPRPGYVTFYFLSYSGIFSYSAKEIELGEGRDKLTNLFHAGHEVISRMREVDQQSRR